MYSVTNVRINLPMVLSKLSHVIALRLLVLVQSSTASFCKVDRVILFFFLWQSLYFINVQYLCHLISTEVL